MSAGLAMADVAVPSACPRCARQRDTRGLGWAEQVRGENELRRLDRHFTELLQELRVVQTGAQILFAFLLGLAFTPRFAALDAEQRTIHLTVLVLAAGSLVLLVAPVSYHRMVFRRRMRQDLVSSAHRFVRLGLALMFLSLVGAVHLVASLVLGRWSAVLAVVLAGAFAVPWYLLPLWHRSQHQHALDQDSPAHTPLESIHRTRHDTFVHGSTDALLTHTERMRALEHEYLRRHPEREVLPERTA